MSPGGFAPAARAPPVVEYAVLPVSKVVGNFPGNTRGHHKRPSPKRGQGWRKGVIITMERGRIFTNTQLFAMNAAAPEGMAPRRINDSVVHLTELPRRAPRGALSRGGPHLQFLVMFHDELIKVQPVSAEQELSRTVTILIVR